MAGSTGGAGGITTSGGTLGSTGGALSCVVTTSALAGGRRVSATTPTPCKKHDGCPSSVPVLWCAIPGLGHTVWGSGAKESWAFMKAL